MLRRSPSSGKAFTLLELIVVIVILGILAALAIPTFARVIDRTKDETAGITLASVARNAQALNGFTKGNAFSALTVEKAVGETVGKTSADAGTFAAVETFELAPGSLLVTPGATGTVSSKYAQVGLALSEQSDVMALSMRSTTERCVWVKAEATSGTIWQVSKDKLTTCDSTFGLTLTGASGEAVDPESPGGGGEIPGEGETPGEGTGEGTGEGDSEVLPPGLMDPNDPNSLPITGVYCTDNNCADSSVLNASVMEVSRLGSETNFLGLAIDADHNQMIATKTDGIYFVDLETGDTRKVYSASGLTDIVYFRGGYLFANDRASFQKFRVTASGVTLVDAKLAELTQHVVGTPSTFDSGPWYSNGFTGDVVGGGAQLYFITGNGLPVTGIFNPSSGMDRRAIAKIDINGNFAPQPVAYVEGQGADPLRFCSISVDANYLYVQASGTSDSAAPGEGQRSGIWRLSKNASNMNLDEIEPWVERPIGCDAYNGNEEMTALGSKLFMADGDSSIISVDKNTGVEKFMAGDATSLTAGGQIGTGREVSFESGTKDIMGMAAYKDKVYVTTGYQGSPIYAMKAGTAPSNDIESRPLSIAAGASPVHIATVPGASGALALNPKNGNLHVGGPWSSTLPGSYEVTPQGKVTPLSGSSFRTGASLIVGDRIFGTASSAWVNQPGAFTNFTTMRTQNNCIEDWSNFQAVDEFGTTWCIDSKGFTSYEMKTRPQLHPVSNMGSILQGTNTEIVRATITGTTAFVVAETSASYSAGTHEDVLRTYRIDLSQSNPTPVLVDEISDPEGSSAWFATTSAVSATDIYMPSAEGVVKISKSGGHTTVVEWPDTSNAIRGTAHDGTSLFFITSSGDVYKVD